MGSLWNRSGIIERYADDLRAAGAQAFFFQGGTTTPLTVFQNSGESAAHSHPLVADAHGRWPDVFVPYVTSYDVQVKTAEGVQLTFTLGIPNPDPVDLSVTVPIQSTVQTGMIHAEFVNTSKAGYVRLNGRTLGNAASGASERANADTENLFTYLWNNLNNTVAPVSGGRTSSGAADFAANKNIQLPDMRGTTLLGLDDMGNSPAGAFGGLTFSSGSATISGSLIGANGVSLTVGNMPLHSHSGSTQSAGDHNHNINGGSGSTTLDGDHTHSWGGVSIQTTTPTAGDHLHTIPPLVVGFATAQAPGGLTVVNSIAYGSGAGASTSGASSDSHSHTVTINSTSTTVGGAHTHSFNFGVLSTTTQGSHAHSFTTDGTGGGAVFNNMAISRLVTWFIKL